jgi:PBP1b-binding outer membrane lipoprotein LpoB
VHKQIVPVVVTVMLMAGCSTPLNNTNASYNNNTKTAAPELQVVSNWLLIAKDVADQIKSSTDKIGAPVFVTPRKTRVNSVRRFTSGSNVPGQSRCDRQKSQ